MCRRPRTPEAALEEVAGEAVEEHGLAGWRNQEAEAECDKCPKLHIHNQPFRTV